LLARKLDNALSTEAELIVSANPGCMLQLSAGLQARGIELPVVHLIELLDRAYQVKSTRPLIEQAAD
ncbi:MAG TPA: hypothetical protein VFI42_09040, partial [Thermomicrobiaceae bacterium]|nr:hypothetical protein [Thermomicrobiaceae bacterium]